MIPVIKNRNQNICCVKAICSYIQEKLKIEHELLPANRDQK